MDMTQILIYLVISGVVLAVVLLTRACRDFGLGIGKELDRRNLRYQALCQSASKEDRLTDNRMKWAEKVLRTSVPASEVGQAMSVMRRRAHNDDRTQSAFSGCEIEQLIEPRFIARNWNSKEPNQ